VGMKFSRPFGTETHRESGPNAEALGYCRPSLRDEDCEIPVALDSLSALRRDGFKSFAAG